MMTIEEADALARLTAYMLNEDRLAEYKGSFRHPNNDIQILEDYLCKSYSTGGIEE